MHALGLGREMLPLVVYGLWWLIGALPALYLWADRAPEHGADDFARPISRVSLLLPWVSILLHLLTLHWLYDLPIYGGYLTPLYLGIAANVAYTLARDSERWRTSFQWGGPLVAVLFSMVYPDKLVFVGRIVRRHAPPHRARRRRRHLLDPSFDVGSAVFRVGLDSGAVACRLGSNVFRDGTPVDELVSGNLCRVRCRRDGGRVRTALARVGGQPVAPSRRPAPSDDE